MSEKGTKRGRDSQGGSSNKKSKTNDYWKKNNYQSLTGIEPGWQGIFATCDKGRESRAVAEMYPILEECAAKLYPEMKKDEDQNDVEEDEEEDIEAAIKKELSEAKDKKKKNDRPIASVMMDVQCVTFFRLKPPLEATDIVRELCESAQKPESGTIRSKFIHRLTPITRTGKATVEGLKEVAMAVLAPHFHSGQKGIKFAIRPTSRNHNVLSRDIIIRTIASCVGTDHAVDLKNPDLLILVELYKNICGMSVVKDFEKLKRFNFGQLQIDASQSGKVAKAEEAKPDSSSGSGKEAKAEEAKQKDQTEAAKTEE